MRHWAEQDSVERKLRLAEWRIDLSGWRSIADARTIINGIWSEVGTDIFVAAGMTFLREYKLGTIIAEQFQGCRLRLVHPEERPDIEIGCESLVRRFEIAEVMRPGRRRTEEYRMPTIDEVESIPPEISHLSPDYLEALRSTANKKTAIAYPEGTELVIYLNSEHFWDDNKVLSLENLKAATIDCKDHFATVWGVLGEKAISIHP